MKPDGAQRVTLVHSLRIRNSIGSPHRMIDEQFLQSRASLKTKRSSGNAGGPVKM